MTRYQRITLFVVIVALLVSLIAPPFPTQMLLQHIPTVLVLIVYPWLIKRYPVTDRTVTCLATFLLLHIVAARYIYSYVPYDRVTQQLFGFSITDTLHFRRNHFDRLVHFSFGLLWVRPIREICVRYFKLSPRVSRYIAFEFVLAASMVYELIEWGLTIVLAPDNSDAYNGQQGDMWDAQKDMFAAMVGAAVATLWNRSRPAH